METFLQIRVSPEEKEKIKNKAKSCGLTVTDLIKMSVEKAKPFSVKNKELEQEKIREIKKAGNNLNQIARWCNIHKTTAETIEVLPYLITIERELKRIAANAD